MTFRKTCPLKSAGRSIGPLYEEYPDYPDLIILRDAAIDERNAVALYLEAALETGYYELFLETAEDEMEHYVEIMQVVSMLDPVQADMLTAKNLNMLTITRPMPKAKAKWAAAQPSGEISAAGEATPLTKNDLPAIRYLTKSLEDELKAVNKYQLYMQQAEYESVQNLFRHLMNEEKKHITEFTAAIFQLTHEPFPMDHD